MWEVYKLPIIIGAGAVFLVAVSLVLLVKSIQTTTPIEFSIATGSGSVAGAQAGELVVDVSGAVVHSGVYKMIEGDRIHDAIQRAGGMTDDADREYVARSLNLALPVTDGMKVYIPSKDKTSHNSNSVQRVSDTSHNLDTLSRSPETPYNVSDQVSINFATQSELESLPGIGPVTAGKIISGRPYSAIDELVAKKAIGQATFSKIKNMLSL